MRARCWDERPLLSTAIYATLALVGFLALWPMVFDAMDREHAFATASTRNLLEGTHAHDLQRLSHAAQ